MSADNASGIKKQLQSGVIRQVEKLGYHLTRNHFYSPIPDTADSENPVWDRASELVGIDLDEERQLQMLAGFAESFRTEYDAFPKSREEIDTPLDFYLANGHFGSVDAEILYCIVRKFMPKRIIEVGSGSSTLLFAQAIRRNKADDPNYACDLTAIEPYPEPRLKQGLAELTSLMPVQVENVDLSVFDQLEANDILFLDSSHVIKVGNDVQFEYLEILPRLNPGVIVHAHDIFLPWNYPKRWITDLRLFWNEQYMLQALLTHNPRFAVMWAGQYMHKKHPEALSQAFGSYDSTTEGAGSFWFQRS